MLFWNRWNQESAGRVYFNISTEKPAHTPDTLHAQTSLLQTWMDQSETLLLFFLETSQRQSCSRVPQSSWSLSSTCAEELWVEIAPHQDKQTAAELPKKRKIWNVERFWRSPNLPTSWEIIGFKQQKENKLVITKKNKEPIYNQKLTEIVVGEWVQ